MIAETQVTDAQLVALAERLGWTIKPNGLIARLEGGLIRYMEPQGLRTWEGFGAIQAAMAGLGYRLETITMPDGSATAVFLREKVGGGYDEGYGESLNSAPDAVVLAARAALGVRGEA